MKSSGQISSVIMHTVEFTDDITTETISTENVPVNKIIQVGGVMPVDVSRAARCGLVLNVEDASVNGVRGSCLPCSTLIIR